jgi:hypothetical protein
VNKGIALKKIFTVRNATEQGNFGTITHQIKCKPKWDNQAKKDLRLGGEGELDCMEDRYDVRNLDEATIFQLTINSVGKV